MRGPHCLPHHCKQLLLEFMKINFLFQRRTKGFQGASDIILLTIETPVNS